MNASGGRDGHAQNAKEGCVEPHLQHGKIPGPGDETERGPERTGPPMLTFLAWLILLVLCWPLALLALVLYPVVWLVLLPFRLAGIAVHGALELVRAVILLPVRVLRLGRA